MRGASPDGGSGGFEYQARPQRGRDVEQEIEISLQEAYHGTTRVFEKGGRRLRVKVPPGARSGTRIRLTGEGTPGTAGGQAGNLYLRARVLPDPRFGRRGDDLQVTVSIDLYTAILGGRTSVPTLNGAVKLTIPAGTQNGQRFRLRGKGMPHLQESEERGDLYAHMSMYACRQSSRQSSKTCSKNCSARLRKEARKPWLRSRPLLHGSCGSGCVLRGHHLSDGLCSPSIFPPTGGDRTPPASGCGRGSSVV